MGILRLFFFSLEGFGVKAIETVLRCISSCRNDRNQHHQHYALSALWGTDQRGNGGLQGEKWSQMKRWMLHRAALTRIGWGIEHLQTRMPPNSGWAKMSFPTSCIPYSCNILLIIFQTFQFNIFQERGLLLLRVRTELKQTLMAYQVFLFACFWKVKSTFLSQLIECLKDQGASDN